MTKEILHMRIDAELKRELKRLAEAEHRNLSNLVEKALLEYVQQNRAAPNKSGE